MPESLEAVLVLALFLVPGYICAVAFTANTPRNDVSDFRFVLQVSFWGALNLLLVLPWTAELLTKIAASKGEALLATTGPEWLRLSTAMVVVPAAMGLALRRVVTWKPVRAVLRRAGLSDTDGVPTGWDSAFKPGSPGAWVYVYVKSKSEPIIGEWGKKSIAGVSPSAHDLFLERQMEWREGQLVPIASTSGVWISEEQIEFIEILRAP